MMCAVFITGLLGEMKMSDPSHIAKAAVSIAYYI